MNFAIVDLECTSLKADQGFLLCGGFKPLGKPPYVVGLHKVGCEPGSRLTIDRKLALAIRAEVEKYDVIVGWNSKMFDIPFLNTRLLLCKEQPLHRPRHIDAMYYARQGQSTLTSSRLDWVSRQYVEKARKTALDLAVWKEAEAEALSRFKGGHKNYDYIVDHCLKDLIVTEEVYERIKPLVASITR